MFCYYTCKSTFESVHFVSRGQFGNEDNSRKTDKKHKVEKRSTSSKAKVKKSQGSSKLQESENWVNPRSSAGLQKNAGSRRVQAVSSTSGHWYTGSDGRRVSEISFC